MAKKTHKVILTVEIEVWSTHEAEQANEPLPTVDEIVEAWMGLCGHSLLSYKALAETCDMNVFVDPVVTGWEKAE